jgi:hypothetical protein
VNAAYQLSISPPATPPPHPDIEGFSLLDQLILHEVCITGYIYLAPTKADHDFEAHVLTLLPLSYPTLPWVVRSRILDLTKAMGGLQYGS